MSKALYPDRPLEPLKVGYTQQDRDNNLSQLSAQSPNGEEDRMLMTCEAFKPNLLDDMTQKG